MSEAGMATGTARKLSEPWKAGLEAMNANRPLATSQAIQSVLARLETGETVKQIAKDLNITEFGLYKALLRNCPQDWQDIQAAKHASKLDNSDEELDACKDGVQLGRVRERISLSKWNLERTCRAIYGDRVTITNEIKPEDRELLTGANDLLKLFREKEVKAEPVDESALTSNSLINKPA